METLNKNQTKISWEFLSFIIICGLVFVLPVFILPSQVLLISFFKANLAYFAILLAFVFLMIDCLRKGEVTIPKSFLLLAGLVVALIWLIASLFSDNINLSLIGQGYEIGTFSFFLFLFLGLFVVSSVFRSEKRGYVFYTLLFISAVLIFIFQFFHILFNINLIPGVSFPYTTSNLIGGWNDLSIFFGFIALVSLVFIELFNSKKIIKAGLFLLLLLSLIAMMAVNFQTNWIVFGFFALIIFLYVFSKNFFEPREKVEISVTPEGSAEPSIKRKGGYNLVRISFFVFLIVAFFILIKSITTDFTTFLKTDFIEVRPSLVATWDVAKQTLKENPFLGSGPNTFLYDWLKFKPLDVNNTIFWNTRFLFGIAQLPSMLATSGIIGGLALLAFLVILVSYAIKVFPSSPFQNDILHPLLMVSFLGSLYLWIFTLIYSPGFLIFALAFLNTGLLVGMLVRADKIKIKILSFLENPKIGFVAVLLIAVFLLGSITSFYILFQKVRAAYFYDKAITIFNSQGNIGETETNLTMAIQLDRQDEYLRSLAEINLLRIQQILSRTDLAAGEARNLFQTALSSAISNAQGATSFNPKDPLNWMELGRIYEAFIPLKIGGADAMAVTSYSKAAEVSPFDPTPLFYKARTEMQVQKLAEAKAPLEQALKLKQDFAPAIYLLSQIEVAQGNLKDAIYRTEQTAILAPNDIGVIFQLGLLYYQNNNLDGARQALERTVSLNPSYANARYFLGLIYDRNNEKAKALEQFKKIAETNPDNQEVKKIIANLQAGKGALEGISPPQQAPEKRQNPPVGENTNQAK